MARHRYVCGACGNTIEASTVDRRLRGSKNHIRVLAAVECECAAHTPGEAMRREEYTPARRDVSSR